jgi:uncharacterized HAD superfamily protein
MTICIDTDGVLLDFLEPFAKWYNANFTDKVHEHHKQDYDLGKGDDKKFFPRIQQFWETPMFGSLPLLDKDAPKYFNLLAEDNTMIIATAVPEHLSAARTRNLNEFKYSGLHFVPKDKAYFIINLIRPSIAIEDKPETIKELYHAGIKVYYPYCKYITGMEKYGTMYKNWKELYGFIAME